MSSPILDYAKGRAGLIASLNYGWVSDINGGIRPYIGERVNTAGGWKLSATSAGDSELFRTALRPSGVVSSVGFWRTEDDGGLRVKYLT